jgi:hypothetical protein
MYQYETYERLNSHFNYKWFYDIFLLIHVCNEKKCRTIWGGMSFGGAAWMGNMDTGLELFSQDSETNYELYCKKYAYI